MQIVTRRRKAISRRTAILSAFHAVAWQEVVERAVDMTDATNKKFWDRTARFYASFQERGNRRMYESLCALIEKEAPSTSSVLELGCGSGQLTVPLCQKFDRWEATDYSANMVDQARKRISDDGVNFAVQDATNLTYPKRVGTL